MDSVESKKLSPRVSIIFTSFNHEKYIDEAIRSVLSQTYRDYELIIWDDASTDRSWEIICQYKDPRIKTFRNQSNSYYTINQALKSGEVKGEYVAIHHSDDIWFPEKLQKQVEYLDGNKNIGAVFTHAQIIDENGRPFTRKDHFYYEVFDQPNRSRYEWLRFFFVQGNALCHPSVLIRRECYAKCGLYRYGLAQVPDLDMWIRLCFLFEIHIVQEKLVKFRVRDKEANVSGDKPQNRMRGALETVYILDNYKKISSGFELLQIFPECKKYNVEAELGVPFGLAMTALELKISHSVEYFALKLLYDLFSDEDKGEYLEKYHDFSYTDFIHLTAIHDPLSIREVFERDFKIGDLSNELAELNAKLVGSEQALIELNSTLAKREQSVIDLKSALELNEQSVAELNSIVASRDESIKELNGTVTKQGERINELSESLNHSNLQVSSLEEGYRQLLNSSSWRLTAPLRVIKLTLSNFYGGLKDIGRSLKSKIESKMLVRTLHAGVRKIRRLLKLLVLRLESEQLERRSKKNSNGKNEKWSCLHDSTGQGREKLAQQKICNLSCQPTISLVASVNKDNYLELSKTLISLEGQLYKKWELILLHEGNIEDRLRSLVEKYGFSDQVVKVSVEDENKTRSLYYSAFLHVSSDWIVLLASGDVLSSEALYFLARTISENPSARLIYADEDTLDESERNVNPRFKPDWSPHLLCSKPYLGNMICISKGQISYWLSNRAPALGDYETLLGAIADLNTDSVIHIPKILIHCTNANGDSSRLGAVLKNSNMGVLSAVREFVRGRYPGKDIEVIKGSSLDTCSLRFDLPESILVSIIIPTKDKVELLSECVESILNKTSWCHFEIIILNNRSMEAETYSYFNDIVRKDERVRVLPVDLDFNWSKLNNLGVSAANGDVYVFLNNDTKVISKHWLNNLAGYALLPDVGTVGGLLLFDDNTIQHSGVVVGMSGWADHVYRTQSNESIKDDSPFVSPYVTRNVLAVTGACMAVAKDTFKALGGFDEEFIICGSDVELCIRAWKKNLYNVMCAEARLYHYESKTRSNYIPNEDFVQSNKKYAPYRTESKDPFYNANLSLSHTKPTLNNKH